MKNDPVNFVDSYNADLMAAFRLMMLSNPRQEIRDGDRLTCDNDVTVGSATLYRLREGIERFFITDINNPAGSAVAQSEIWVNWDMIRKWVGNFSHIPGGANVLYMDGHVEFVKYPSEGPCTVAFAELF